jgi:hypothetical protein
MNETQTKEFNSLCESIVEELIWDPGSLIYIPDRSELKAAQVMIDMLWNSLEPDEIYYEMVRGGYSSILANIVNDYADRAKMLKPTLISVNPQNTEFYRYFDEAMKAWLYGLNSSALMLCCSIIEDILKTELYNIDPDLALDFERKGNIITGVKRNRNMQILINSAFDYKIIDKKHKSFAHKIRTLRNDAIHTLEKIDDKQTYQAILNTKDLIEKILSKSHIF